MSEDIRVIWEDENGDILGTEVFGGELIIGAGYIGDGFLGHAMVVPAELSDRIKMAKQFLRAINLKGTEIKEAPPEIKPGHIVETLSGSHEEVLSVHGPWAVISPIGRNLEEYAPSVRYMDNLKIVSTEVAEPEWIITRQPMELATAL